MPRLYREAPVNSIWEGSGNVNALDLLRAISAIRRVSTRTCRTSPLPPGVMSPSTTYCATYSMRLAQNPAGPPARARWLAEKMALLLQAAFYVDLRTRVGGGSLHRRPVCDRPRGRTEWWTSVHRTSTRSWTVPAVGRG